MGLHSPGNTGSVAIRRTVRGYGGNPRQHAVVTTSLSLSLAPSLSSLARCLSLSLVSLYWHAWRARRRSRAAIAPIARAGTALVCGSKHDFWSLDSKNSLPAAVNEQVKFHLKPPSLGAILKLPLTTMFYIYEWHKEDLHLLSHFREVDT